jgi:hypothetical protein
MAYNTVPFHGRLARVEKNDVAVDFSVDWSISVSVDLADSNRQGQAWKENVVGQSGATGSCTFHFVAGNTEQKAMMDNIITASPGTKLTDIIFLLDGSTNGFTGDIFLNGFSTSGAVGDTVNCSFDFTYDGAIAISAAT